MQIIPILNLHRDTIENISSLLDELKKLPVKQLYVYDLSGIQKNEPQVDTYQRLSAFFDIWVDAGPRDTDDIVDDLFTGANRIIIRPHLWMEEDIKEVHHLTENEIFFFMTEKDLQQVDLTPFQDPYGMILNASSTKPLPLSQKNMIKTMMQMHPFYVFQPNIKDNEFYENINLLGVIIDREEIETWTK